jgi:exopolyphosphatase/guanosine-5'-triphosphate,3'-diphosphate pyrophosphatase
MRRGVIDIGTNSVKLLVADVSDANILPVRETSRQTRLGRGLYDGGKLQPGPIQATVAAISELRDLAKMDDCRDTRIIATSAVREAANAGELLDALAQSTDAGG